MNSAEALLAIMDRKGFDPDPEYDQASAIPLAERWLTHYGSLLAVSPLSAVGPLATLIADVRLLGQKEKS